MNRFLKVFTAVLVVCLLFASCASTPDDPEPKQLTSKVTTEILEHKGTALGITTLPVWVSSYVELGVRGVEKLSDFSEEYCFVAEMTADNLNAGQAWLNGFEVPQIIARQLQSRVESLFVGAAVGAPEDDYGTYFENVVRTTTDVSFSGAKKVSDWWSLIRKYDPDIKKAYTDAYYIYVLYTMPKELLDRQLLDQIEKAEEDSEMSEAQRAAFDNVKAVLAQSGL